MISILRAFTYVPMPIPIYLHGGGGGSFEAPPIAVYMLFSSIACLLFALCALLVDVIRDEVRGEDTSILWTIAPLILSAVLMVLSFSVVLVCKAVGV